MAVKSWIKKVFIVYSIINIFLLSGCDPEQQQHSWEPSDNTPQINNVSPSSVFIGPDPVSLSIYGENFTPDSIVTINGIKQNSDYISSKEIRSFINTDKILANSLSQQDSQTHQICFIQIHDRYAPDSKPFRWPTRKPIFKFSSPIKIIQDKINHTNWDIELDKRQGIHILLETFDLCSSCRESYGWADLYIISSYNNGKTWHRPVLIRKNLYGYYNINNGLSTSVDLIIDHQGNLFAAYDENTQQQDNFGRIGVMVSRDRGKTWGETIIIRKTNSLFLNQIESTKEKTFIIYSDKIFGSMDMNDQWIMLESSDMGSTWEQNLEGSSGNAVLGYKSDENKCFLFVGSKSDNENDYMQISSDDAQTWSPSVEFPHKLAVNQITFGSNNLIHVVSAYPYSSNGFTWLEYHYQNSSNNGLDWENQRKVFFNHISLDAYGLIYAIDKNLHLGDADGKIWYNFSPGFLSEASWYENKIRIDKENNIHICFLTVDQNGKKRQHTLYYTRSI